MAQFGINNTSFGDYVPSCQKLICGVVKHVLYLHFTDFPDGRNVGIICREQPVFDMRRTHADLLQLQLAQDRVCRKACQLKLSLLPVRLMVAAA